MRRGRRTFDIFNLSFLDVISCGFGAIVLLVLISDFATAPEEGADAPAGALLRDVLQAERRVADLEAAVVRAAEDAAAKRLLLDRLEGRTAQARQAREAGREQAERLEEDLAGLEVVRSALDRTKRASISQAGARERDAEVGGIPVDSDYVVFIVDTSGSMKQIWSRVVDEVENVIRIHPDIKGFQILNDNGAHLLSGYEGRWIPDSPRQRENAIELFRSWNSASNSSPVEGLEVALRRYVNPNSKVSIYIFGDEYSGSSYDPVIEALVRQNTNRITGRRLARVHAVGFVSPQSTGRFATLMREVTRRSEGSFVALPR